MTTFRNQFPSVGMGVPNLAPEDVTRYRQLGREAREHLESGDPAAAEPLLRQQIEIYPHNPEPYLGLTILACKEGDTREALDRLCDAVGRGQLDLEPIESSDDCIDLCDLEKYNLVFRATSYLKTMDKQWSQWESFQTERVPQSVAEIDAEIKHFISRIEKMAPALGPRNTEKWIRWFQCAEVVLLESYVAEQTDRKDFRPAMDRLMALYEREELFQWRYYSPRTSARLARVAEAALQEFPEKEHHADALMLSAISRYTNCWMRARRQRQTRLMERDYMKLIGRLEEIRDTHPDSPRAFDAAMGMISLALGNDRTEEAGRTYRALIEQNAGSTEQLDRIHDSLKSRALYVKGLPEFEAETIDGGRVDFANLEGEVILLDFWAAWCLPCLDEIKKLRKLQEKYADDGFRIVGINLDETEDMDLERLKQWLADKKVTWPQIREGNGWDSELVKALAIEEIPFTVLVDSEGKVLTVDAHDERLRRAVKEAVKGTRSST